MKINKGIIKHLKANINKIDYKTICTIPCDIINKEFNDNEKDKIINTVINHYYINGFPYYKLNDLKLKKI